jgi:hypothetical protein
MLGLAHLGVVFVLGVVEVVLVGGVVFVVAVLAGGGVVVVGVVGGLVGPPGCGPCVVCCGIASRRLSISA